MESLKSTQKSALIVAVTGYFITPFMGSSINVALPAIAQTFHVDAVLLSWIATAYLLAIGVTLVPMGRLSDIYGRKKIMVLGFSFFTIASLLSALSWSVYALIIFRIIQGIGSGMFFGTTMAILTSVYPPGERGKVLGITVSAVYIGLSSGPFIGGILTTQISWRSLFALTFLLSFSVLALIFMKLKGEWAEAKGESFDIWGSLVYGLSLIILIVGFSLLPDKKSIGLILLSVSGFIAFVVLEKRVASPVFQMDLLRHNKVFALSNLAALIHYSSTFAVTFLLSLYLQYIKSLNAQTAGLILMAQPVMMALFSPLAGKISDRIEPRLISSAGMALTSCGIMLFTRLTADTHLFYIVATLLLLGFGFAIFSSPNMNAIMSSVERRFLGVASGSAGTMRVLGQLFSMGIATLVLAVTMGRVPITAAVYPQLIKSIKITLIIFSGLTFAGIFASLSRGNVRQHEKQSG
jgi:MFS family permease